MDRLLRVAFEKLVRAGNLRVSTAGGSTFTFGDGTGRPVAIRFGIGVSSNQQEVLVAQLLSLIRSPDAPNM